MNLSLERHTKSMHLLHICYLLLEKEINELEDPNANGFLENSFIGKLVKNLTKRTDVKNYLSLTVKDIIMNLENLSENFMEIDLDKIYEYIKYGNNEKEMYSNSFLEKAKKMMEKIKREEKRKQTITKKSKEKSKEFLAKLKYEPLANKYETFEPVSLPEKNLDLLGRPSISDLTKNTENDNNMEKDYSKYIYF